jgi:hypothetical protein
LRDGRPSDAPCFHVHHNDSVLRIPPDCDACWTAAPTTDALIWSLAYALSTGTTSTHGKFLGVDQMSNHLGLGVVCVGSGSRGTNSRKCGLTEKLLATADPFKDSCAVEHRL